MRSWVRWNFDAKEARSVPSHIARFFYKTVYNKDVSETFLYGSSFINGEWMYPFEKKTQFEVINPAIGETIGVCAAATPEQIDEAFRVANESHMFWAYTVGAEEKEAVLWKYNEKLLKHAELLAELYTLESGKTKKTSIADIVEARHQVKAACYTVGEGGDPVSEPQLMNRLTGSIPLPYRVVLAIKPSNFRAIGEWKVDPAVISGSCVILKEDEHTPFAAMVAMQFFYEALKEVVGSERLNNLKGVLQLLQGPGETVGDYAVNAGDHENRLYDHLSFTGGWRTGAKVAPIAASKIISQTLELSGHNRILDWYDCPIETAADEIVLAAFGDNKQRCVSAQVVFTPRIKALLPAVIKRTKKLKIGHPWKDDTDIGPFICKQYFDAMVRGIEEAKEYYSSYIGGYPLNTEPTIKCAVSKGFNIDPKEFEDLKDGYYYAPTIFADMPWTHPLMKYELFGPVLLIQDLDWTYENRFKQDLWIDEYIKIRGLADVENIKQFLKGIALMNDNLFGLSGACLAYDMRYWMHFLLLAQYGLVYRRGTTGAMVDKNTNFGGVRLSGYGREGGGTKNHVQIKQFTIDFGQKAKLAQRDK